MNFAISLREPLNRTTKPFRSITIEPMHIVYYLICTFVPFVLGLVIYNAVADMEYETRQIIWGAVYICLAIYFFYALYIILKFVMHLNTAILTRLIKFIQGK